MMSKFEKRARKRFRSGWVICVAAVAATGCSLSPSKEKITIAIDLGGSARNAGFSYSSLSALTGQDEGYVHDPNDPHSPPPDVDSFNCFMVNVSGPGIGYFNESGGYGYPAGCSYPGVVSALFSDSARVVELEVPSGRSRRIQVIGLKVAGGKCPASESFASLSDYRPYLLGETKADLLSDASVEVRNKYHYSNSWSEMDPFYCPAHYTDGSGGIDPGMIPNMVARFDAEHVKTVQGYAHASTFADWDNLGTGAFSLYTATGPALMHGELSGLAMAEFSAGAHFYSEEATELAADQYTWFAVLKTPATGSMVTAFALTYFDGVSYHSDYSALHFDTGSGSFFFASTDSAGNPAQTPFGGATPGAPVIVSGTRSSSSLWYDFFINGSMVGGFSAEAALPGSQARLAIGSDDNGVSFEGGMVGEFIFYSSELSESERVQVECYLSGKWGVGVSHSCP